VIRSSDRPRQFTPERPWVLGVGSALHNGSACLLHGDEICVAVQEERLLRRKRASLLPAYDSLAVRYCLDSAGIGPEHLDAVGVCAFNGDTAAEDIRLNSFLDVGRHGTPVFVIPHHLGHAVAVYATSGFSDASVLVVDGNGSFMTALNGAERAAVLDAQKARYSWADPTLCEILSVYEARGSSLRPVEKHVASRNTTQKAGMPRFFSLGRLFENVAIQIFGQPLDGPGKVMGLAPFGRPTIPVAEFFEIRGGEFIFRDAVPDRFLHNERWPLHEADYADLAASVQVALESALSWLAIHVQKLCPANRLCYTGGVALNGVANTRLIAQSGFDEIFIMPASEDSGVAVGAAFHSLWQISSHQKTRRWMHDGTGKIYTPARIAQSCSRYPGLSARTVSNPIEEAAQTLVNQEILGWFHGGSELGPRALGHRSILCDPRNARMKDVLNHRIKFRESYRPYAPVIPLEFVQEWFEVGPGGISSPFMLRVLPFRLEKRALVPAVVHVDGTGRLQTVTHEANGPLYDLIMRFYEITGVPILLNTSFNMNGEPIVETPDDALTCFLATDMDACLLDATFVSKVSRNQDWLDFVPVLRQIETAEERFADPTPQLRPFGVLDSFAEGMMPMASRQRDKIRQDYLRVRVESPWGPVYHDLTTDFGDLLAQIDGTRTGWHIHEWIKVGRSEVTEKVTRLLLVNLHRCGIISLKP
jgi:carbamoyltransferase